MENIQLYGSKLPFWISTMLEMFCMAIHPFFKPSPLPLQSQSSAAQTAACWICNCTEAWLLAASSLPVPRQTVEAFWESLADVSLRLCRIILRRWSCPCLGCVLGWHSEWWQTSWLHTGLLHVMFVNSQHSKNTGLEWSVVLCCNSCHTRGPNFCLIYN